MALTSGNNSSLVKTELDEVLFTNFDREQEPGEVTAADPIFFVQKSTDRQAHIYEEITPPGEFTTHAELEAVEEATIRSGNQVTKTILNYKRDIPIPDEFFQDDQHNTVSQQIKWLGLRARTSRDKFAFEQSYGDGFSGVTTPDGSSLYNNSHTTLNGGSVDNLETGSLTADNLFTLIKSLRLQKAQDDALGAHNVVGLLVPTILHKTAVEIAESELEANTTDNNLNYFSRIYPGMVVGSSAYLDSAFNSLNTNADTSYFVVSRNHEISRIQRMPLQTKLVPPDTDRQDRWFYRAKFREVVAAQTWEGTAGSNGTA